MFPLKLSFMSVRDGENFNISTVVLFIVWQTTQYIVLTMQYLYLPRNKGPTILFPTRNKRAPIAFHKSQGLNLGNQYNENAT